jgi:hypothetical protein
MQQWYKFIALNCQAVCGYGSEAEAEIYCDILNRGRSVGLYRYIALATDDCRRLDEGDDIDGFDLDDAITIQAEIDEAQVLS